MNNLAITIVVILLPGLISCLLCETITVHDKKWDSFKYYVYSFIFGVLSYLLIELAICITYSLHGYLPIQWKLPYPDHLGIWDVITGKSTAFSWLEILFTTVFASPIIAMSAAALVNHKIFNRFALWTNISSKYGDENLFSFFLNAKEVHWVYIRDKNIGLTYFGKIYSYSECDSIQELVLVNVIVYEYETSEELYSLHSIYLSKSLGEFVIEVPELLEESVNVKETAE